jgi:protein MAK11
MQEISPVVTYDSKGSRLTCITLADGEMSHPEHLTPETGAKRKRDLDDSDAKEEEAWQGLAA